jgi:ATP-dependent DNA helicase RecG
MQDTIQYKTKSTTPQPPVFPEAPFTCSGRLTKPLFPVCSYAIIGRINERNLMPEKQTVEWKSSWRDEWLEWICGYANAQGGILYIGKDDAGNVIGVKKAKKLSEDIPNKIRNYLGIVADVNLLEKNGLDYFQIVVDPYSSPISYHGKYFYRSGSVKCELTGTELDAFLLKRFGKTWDGVAVPRATVDELKGDSLKMFRAKARKSGRLTENELNVSNEVLLQNLRLIEEGQLLKAAVMLFHEDPERWAHSAYIKIGYFENSDSALLYQDEIHGPLIEQVDRAVDLIYTKYLKALIWYDDIQRVETFMFPRDGCRELVLNAVQHKDYLHHVPIQISVYPDGLYIFNPGEMPAALLPTEKLFSKHPSLPRNPNIATTFFKSGMVESWGRGYEKVAETCAASGAELPIVKADFGGVMVRIVESSKYKELRLTHADLSHRDATDATKDATEKLLLELIGENGAMTQSEMADRVKVHRATIARKLGALKRSGKIERVGSDRNGYWIVLK